MGGLCHVPSPPLIPAWGNMTVTVPTDSFCLFWRCASVGAFRRILPYSVFWAGSCAWEGSPGQCRGTYLGLWGCEVPLHSCRPVLLCGSLGTGSFLCHGAPRWDSASVSRIHSCHPRPGRLRQKFPDGCEAVAMGGGRSPLPGPHHPLFISVSRELTLSLAHHSHSVDVIKMKSL